MSDTPTTMVKGSNIGFVLGILVIVGVAIWLYRSGFMAERFGLGQNEQVAEVLPTPLPEIEAEPITLLDEEPMAVTESQQPKPSPTPTPVVKHVPVETSVGDSPAAMVALLLVGAGMTYGLSRKLAN